MTITDTRRRDPRPGRAAPRQLRATDQMVDDAAGVFARRGLATTPLKQVAFTVAFAGTGLRQYFPTREAVLAAALEVGRRHGGQILARVADLPLGIDRDRSVVEWAVDFALRWPGVCALRQSIVTGQVPDVEVERQGFVVLTALGVDCDAHERMVNVALAFAGLHAAAAQLAGHEHPAGGRDLIVAATMRTLGHADAAG